jgi:hypothetical protein
MRKKILALFIFIIALFALTGCEKIEKITEKVGDATDTVVEVAKDVGAKTKEIGAVVGEKSKVVGAIVWDKTKHYGKHWGGFFVEMGQLVWIGLGETDDIFLHTGSYADVRTASAPGYEDISTWTMWGEELTIQKNAEPEPGVNIDEFTPNGGPPAEMPDEAQENGGTWYYNLGTKTWEIKYGI